MSAKRDSLEIISISLSRDMVQEMNRSCQETGYTSRSELIRDSIRTFMRSNQDLDKLSGRLEGVLVLLYDHAAASRVSDVRHRHTEVFRSFMHSDFSERSHKCCEVLMFSGDADDVRKAHNALRALKGVEEARIFLA